VILAGGSGTRLWPLSRRGRPKQFLPLAGGTSLLERAWRHLDGLVEEPRRWVCAGEEQREPIQRALGLPPGHEKLAATVREGFAFAAANPRALLTFGVSPTHPATGYGYLELGKVLVGRAREVKRFRVKPDSPPGRRASSGTAGSSCGRSPPFWNASAATSLRASAPWRRSAPPGPPAGGSRCWRRSSRRWRRAAWTTR
jgi:mannose-1-phosphate guanylyltransferase